MNLMRSRPRPSPRPTLRSLIATLPEECAQKILAYTYSPQPDDLLEAIRERELKEQLFIEWARQTSEMMHVMGNNWTFLNSPYKIMMLDMGIFIKEGSMFHRYFPPMKHHDKLKTIVFNYTRRIQCGGPKKLIDALHRVTNLMTLREMKSLMLAIDRSNLMRWLSATNVTSDLTSTGTAPPPYSWMYEANGELKPEYAAIIADIRWRFYRV